MKIGDVVRLPVLSGLPLMAVRAALLEWYRAAELSCDRAATLVNRDPRVTCRTLMVMASGLPSERLDLDAFVKQANEYEEWDSSMDRVRRFFTEISLTHSYPVRRVPDTERFRTIFKDASDSVASAGDQVASAGTRLADWLRGPEGDRRGY